MEVVMKPIWKVVVPSGLSIEGSVTYLLASLRELRELFSSSAKQKPSYFDSIFEGLEELG